MTERLEIEIIVQTNNAGRQIGGLSNSLQGLGQMLGGSVNPQMAGLSSILSQGVNPAMAGMGGTAAMANPYLLALKVALEGIKMAAMAAVAGASALAAGLTIAIKEAMGAEKVLAQLNAAIRSMGTGFKSSDVIGWVDALARSTGLADEALQSGANMLLTFANIGRGLFADALGIAADLSVAWGMSMEGAATKVGKVLNDPIAGISALTEVGITFTAEQKETIKSMMELNDVAGAQALIMAELERQVGGSSEAYGNTLTGSIGKLKNEFSNLLETIGQPFLEPLTNMINNFVLPAFEKVKAFLQPLIDAFGMFFYALDQGFRPIEAVQIALAGIIPPSLAKAVGNIFGAFDELGRAFSSSADERESLGQTMGRTLGNFLISVLPGMINIAAEAVRLFASVWREYGPGIISTADKLIGVLGTFGELGVEHTLNSISGAMQSFNNIFRAASRGVLDDSGKLLTGLPAIMYQAGQEMIKGLANGIKSNPAVVQGAMDTIVDAAITAFKRRLGIASPSKVFEGFGGNLMQGLALGIQGGVAAPQAAMIGATSSIMTSATTYGAQYNNYAPIQVYPKMEAMSMGEILNQMSAMMGPP